MFLQGPTLMGLGFLKRAYYLVTPEQGNCDTQRWFETTDHLLYNADTRDLYYPSGLRCRFGASTACYLPTPGNVAGRLVLTITRDGVTETYVQYVQGSQARTVVIDYGTSPVTLTAGGQTWTYTVSQEHLLSAQDPVGQIWAFTYVEDPPYLGRLIGLTTPGGGQVGYEYEFVGDPGWFLHFRDQRDVAGGDLRRWTIGRTFPTECHYPGNACALPYWWATPATTQIVTPGGAVYGGGECLAPAGFFQSGDIPVGGIHTCATYSSERVDSSETWTRTVFKDYTPSVRLVQMQSTAVTVAVDSTIVPNDQSFHTTTVTAMDDCGQPLQITETSDQRPGESRVTSRTYLNTPGCTWEPSGLPDPSTFVYRLGLVTQDTVSENGSAAFVRQEADYDATTGFKNWERLSGIQINYSPTGEGLVQTVTTATGIATTFGYDWGEVSSIQTPAYTVTRDIHADGRVWAETQAGRTTTYVYDALGRATETHPPGNTTPIITTFTSPTQVTTTRGGAWVRTTTDGFGRSLETLDSTGVRTATRYDVAGRVAFVSLPSFDATPTAGTSFEYDSRGRVIREAHFDAGNPIATADRAYQYHHDLSNVRDENGHGTWFRRQMLGTPADDRLVALFDAAEQSWAYSYNALGSLTAVTGPTNGAAITRTWTYAPTTNHLLSETHPESGTVTYPDDPGDAAYYPDGAVRRRSDANGTAFRYTYDDPNGRLSTVTATPPSGAGAVEETTITYTPQTDLVASTTITVGGVQTTKTEWAYESATGRLHARTDTVDGKVFETTFAYDADDNLTEVVYPSGRHVFYAYNADGQLQKVCRVACAGATAAELYASAFEYEASGALTTYTAGNGVLTTLTYGPHRQRLSTLVVGPTAAPLMGLAYHYDPGGNVTGIDDLVRPAWTQSFSGYDVLDRLTQASAPAYGTLTFAYDAHGNRQSAGGTTYTYREGNPFQLQTINGGFDLQYDANGNLRSGFGGQYDYTPGNQLKTGIVNGITTQYAYDADQWRVKKTVGSQVTVYSVRGPNGELLSEWTNADPTATVRDYIYAGGRLIATTTAHRDHK